MSVPLQLACGLHPQGLRRIKRVRFCLLLLFLFSKLFFPGSLFAQPTDTLLSGKDSNQIRTVVRKEVQRWRDSMDAVRIKTDVQKHGKPFDAFLAEMRERESKQMRQLYVRIGLGVAFLIVVLVGFLRRRRKR